MADLLLAVFALSNGLVMAIHDLQQLGLDVVDNGGALFELLLGGDRIAEALLQNAIG